MSKFKIFTAEENKKFKFRVLNPYTLKMQVHSTFEDLKSARIWMSDYVMLACHDVYDVKERNEDKIVLKTKVGYGISICDIIS